MARSARLFALLRPADSDQTGFLAAFWAIGSVIVGGYIAWMLEEHSDLSSPYPVLLLAVFASCYFAGAKAGILAAVLGAAGSQALAAMRGFHATDLNDASLFGLASVATISLTAVTIRRGRAAREARAAERTAQSNAVVTARELDLLIDSASEYAICLLDPEGRMVIWNNGAERLFGWRASEVAGQSQAQLFSPKEGAERASQEELSIARRDGRFAGRRECARKDGSSFLADVVLTRIDDDDGSVLGFGKVVRDITQEQADADAIEAREAHLHTILATVPDAMVVIDEQGLILSFSSAAENMFGYGEAEMIGRNVSVLMPAPDRDRHDGYIARYRQTGEKRIIGQTRRVFGQRKDGTTFPHELSVAEAVGGGRRVFTAFIRDMSAAEEAEARLQELQAELLHISRISAIGTMATTLAHELNQPLTAVTNYVQTSAALLEHSEKDGENAIHEALVEAGKEALRAGTIVRRLREFVARGELDRTIEPVTTLIEDAVAIGMVGARVRGVEVRTQIPDGVGFALVDRVQIQQVLINLIRNAIEAITEGADNMDGTILVSVEPQGEMLLFSVSDNGPGLPAEMQQSLFDAFVSSKSRGMGLGLSICRTIVEAHGGRISCDSRTGGGTVFHFTLPAIGQETNYA